MTDGDLRTRLEPLAKSDTSGPPSLPTVFKGEVGIWRTVRGHRMFIELDVSSIPGVTADVLARMSETEKLERFKKFFDDKGILRPEYRDEIKQGRILVGPADVVGREIGNVSVQDIERLTPKATKAEFSKLKVHQNGVKALKASILSNLKRPDDTRRKRLESAGSDSVEALVPIARSSGLKTDQIKEILRTGKQQSAENPDLNVIDEKKKEERPAPKARLSPVAAPKLPASVATAREGAAAARAVPAVLESEAGLTPEKLLDVLKRLRDSRNREGFKKKIDKLITRLKVENSDNAVREIARAAVDTIKRELKLEGAALSAVDGGKEEQDKPGKPRLRAVEPSRPKVEETAERDKDDKERLSGDKKLTREAVRADRKAVQSALQSIQSDAALDEMAKEFLEQLEGDKEKARIEALNMLLGRLESTVRIPQVKREVARIRARAKRGGMSRVSIAAALIQLLRLILTLLIPG